MKKNLFFATVIGLSFACKKNTSSSTETNNNDTTPPVITLNGSINDTVTLNTSYSDPGATSQDNNDGNISGSIIKTGTINKDLVGEYRLYYNVKDAAGNAAAQMTRYVYVKNDAAIYAGVYDVTPNCGATGINSSTVAFNPSTTMNNVVSFGIPGNATTILPTITINGNTINVPLQTKVPGKSIIGNGTIAGDKKSFVFTYTVINGGYNAYNDTMMCTAQYLKK